MHVQKIGLASALALVCHNYRYVGDGRQHEGVKHQEFTKDNIVIGNPDDPKVYSFGEGVNTFKRMQNKAFADLSYARLEHEETAGRRPKRNSVGLISTVVTLPFDWPDNKDKLAFFEAAYKALGEYYNKNGVDNEYILPASIHYDETTPHMHVLVIPMRNGRLDGSSLVNKRFLGELHPFVQSKVEEYTNVKCSVMLDDDDKLQRAISKLDREDMDLVNNYIREQEKRIKERDKLIREREKKLIRREEGLKKKEKQLEEKIKAFAYTEGRMKALEQANISVIRDPVDNRQNEYGLF